MANRCEVCNVASGPLLLYPRLLDYKGIHQNVWAHEKCVTLKYRLITSGPRKGDWVLKKRAERRKERAAERMLEEERLRKEVEKSIANGAFRAPLNPQQKGKAIEEMLTFLGVYVFLFLPYGLLILLFNILGKHNLSWLVLPIILIDLIGGRLYRRPRNLGKHIPFYWIFRGKPS